MKRRKHRTPMAAIDQINVTPLLDLTFLLLIAFMLTMPLMEYGTSVNPPEMNAKPLPEQQFWRLCGLPERLCGHRCGRLLRRGASSG